MLETLEITNFQCHKEIKLDFDPGVNVIAGTSDSGKSAILKGLLWLITNRPQGLGFRNMLAKRNENVSVKIVLDGQEVIRARSESVNEYLLDGQKFVAMKNDVPKDIAQFLNLLPVNIQMQFHPQYLLSASSGEVAKVLNESCDLAVIDTTMKRIKAIEQAARVDARAMENQEKDLQDDLDKLDWVDDANEKVEMIKSQILIVERQKEDIDDFSLILDGLKKVDDKIEDMEGIDRLWENFQVIQSEVGSWQKDAKNVDILEAIVGQILVINAEMNKKYFDMAAALIALQNEVGVLQEEAAQSKVLDELLVSLSGVSSMMTVEREQQEDIQKELIELWKSVEFCPLCGHKVR